MIGSKSNGFVNQVGEPDHDLAKPSQIVHKMQVNQINPTPKSSISITKVPSKLKASVTEPVSDDDTTTSNQVIQRLDKCLCYSQLYWTMTQLP